MQATISKYSLETESRNVVSPSGPIALITLLILAALAVLSLYQITPPAAVAQGAPLTEFSSGRAMTHLAVIADKPHPLGSAEHENVAEYIIKELTALGLRPEIQETSIVSQRRGYPFVGATVKNILVRLGGTNNSRAVLFTAHYDSVPTGPGASDDGAAVVAMLESLRALRAGAPLRNDLLFLFTDAEEVGLLGAKAFADENPVAEEIGIVLNFEARGNGGPSIMFETSNGNGLLIKEFAKAVSSPVANSLSYEIYKRIPNDSDLSIFKEAGFAGLNFAYIKGLNHYHTEIDNIETIDERSLQHHGDYLLSLARHFGNADISQLKGDDAVYFHVLAPILIHYSVAWVKYFVALVTVVFVSVLVLGFRRKQLTLRGIFLGFLTLLASMIASALLVTLTWRVITTLHSGYGYIFQSDTYNGYLYLISFVSLSCALTSTLYVWAWRKKSVEDLVVGGLLWWLILTILTGIYLPGGSYLFTWPLLFSLIAVIFRLTSKDWRPSSPKRLAVLSICAIPGILLLVPMIYMLYLAMTLRMSAALAIMVVLLLGLLIPHLELVVATKQWLLPASALLVSIAFLVAGSLTSGFDRNHRQPNSILYAMNADSGKAVWASFDRSPDEWTSQFFVNGIERDSLSEYIPLGTDGMMKSQAAAIQLNAPSIEVLGDSTTEGVRVLSLRVTSSRQAPVLIVTTEPDTEILTYIVNQKQMTNRSGQRWGLRYYALPKGGLELTLRLKASGLVKIRVTDQSYELPQGFNPPFSSRPDYMMPSIMPYSDSTLVSKSFAF